MNRLIESEKVEYLLVGLIEKINNRNLELSSSPDLLDGIKIFLNISKKEAVIDILNALRSGLFDEEPAKEAE